MIGSLAGLEAAMLADLAQIDDGCTSCVVSFSKYWRARWILERTKHSGY